MRIDGSLARKLDFGDITTTTLGRTRLCKAELRLRKAGPVAQGPEKYRALDHRRHQAQIRARRALGLV